MATRSRRSRPTTSTRMTTSSAPFLTWAYLTDRHLPRARQDSRLPTRSSSMTTRRAAVGLLFCSILGAGAPPPGTEPNATVSAAPDPSSGPDEREPYDPELAAKTVAFWEDRVKQDPEGVIELRELASAYLARQRETGDIEDAVKAEDAARRSLKLVKQRNAIAWIRLARSLLAQHRFPEALAAAK